MLSLAADGALEAAEGEIQRTILHARSGEIVGAVVGAARQPLDHRPARIAEAEQLGDLVEGLAGGVVPRPGEHAIDPFFRTEVKRGVAARDDQGDGGEFDLRMLDEC